LENWGVRCITEDKAGRLWIGTSGTGLLCLEDGEFKSYRRSDGLAHDSVYCVYIDADQTLWIGTEGGLSRWRGGRFANFTTSQGLPDDVICHIAEDQRGCLWCSSRKGVFRVARSDMDDFERQQLKTIPCVTFDQTDGLPSRECAGGSQPSGCTTRDGRLLIPTLKGVAVVRPDAIVLNPLPPPVTIEEVLVDGQDQGPKWQPQKAVGADLAQAAPAPKSAPFLEIPPGRSRLEIHYTALSFVDPHKVRFKLKLEPLERDWVEVGGLRTVNYSYLPPGEYHFMVLACNNDGVWNRQGATLAFTVRPHFYQSSWFMGAATLFVLGAVGGGARYATRRRLQRKLNQLERQHALEKERMRIARDLHDEIGADLTQMTLQGELAQRESLSLPEVRSQVASLTDKTRQLVRSMEEIVWAVNPRNDPLPNFSSYLCFFAQEFLRSTSIRCRLDVMPGLPPVNFSVQERHNFFLAVKEAFHNIVQHSGATEAWLRIQFEESWLTVTVEDNGQGFDPAHNGEAANGLRNMRDRMQKIGGRMELHSAPGVGARICFIVTANCRQATEPAQDHLPSR
jgi:signal transduction histidine kinase